jgi:hypothetical protein
MDQTHDLYSRHTVKFASANANATLLEAWVYATTDLDENSVPGIILMAHGLVRIDAFDAIVYVHENAYTGHWLACAGSAYDSEWLW